MSDIFNTSTSFESMGLRDSVLKGVKEAGFEHPTEIQARLIPETLAGKDVLGQSKTGTGKTAAFGLPILHMADKDTPLQALILVPTRELANQVTAEINELGKHTPIRAFSVIGGESMKGQLKNVKEGAHIIVGTPGRVMDLHGRRQLHFDNIRFAVLDEVDRMFDIGFRDDIRKILKQIHSKHQTIFVSATIDGEIEALARKNMSDNVVRIESDSKSLTVSQVTQHYLPVAPWDKRALLLHLLRHEEPDTTVVFCRMKVTVHKLGIYLREKGIDAREIHGDMPQEKRNKVMKTMREGKLDVLIASDLAARGLDIDHITHVINYDLPEDPEVYVHRIGRTARAGRNGVAWAFVTPDEGQRLSEIEKLTGVLIDKMEYPDFKPGPVPDDAREQLERAAKPQAADWKEKLSARVANQGPSDEYTPEQLAAMFPDGKVPTSLPKRTLGSRFRTRRR